MPFLVTRVRWDAQRRPLRWLVGALLTRNVAGAQYPSARLAQWGVVDAVETNGNLLSIVLVLSALAATAVLPLAHGALAVVAAAVLCREIDAFSSDIRAMYD